MQEIVAQLAPLRCCFLSDILKARLSTAGNKWSFTPDKSKHFRWWPHCQHTSVCYRDLYSHDHCHAGLLLLYSLAYCACVIPPTLTVLPSLSQQRMEILMAIVSTGVPSFKKNDGTYFQNVPRIWVVKITFFKFCLSCYPNIFIVQ